MKIQKLFYPAIFQIEQEGGYSVAFPDVQGCITQGEDMQEAYEMSVEALGLVLSYLKDEKKEIPKPSLPNEIKTEKNQFIVIVEFDMQSYLKKHCNKAVKKTLSIPQWLNEEAESVGINFSQVLQNALKKELGIK